MHTAIPIWVWGLFHIVVFAVLAFDLGFVNKDERPTTLPLAIGLTVAWVVLSLGFCLGIHAFIGPQKALEFLTGYVVEYALSVDNIFVFILIFGYFKVPERFEHKILFWGIVGAFVLRGLLIFGGTALIARFSWLDYVFGAFLIYTGVKLAFDKGSDVDPGANPVVNFLARFVPFTKDYEEARFFVRKNGLRYATPLLAVLLVVETTDLLFALDSIPAILAISRDTFIVYTSNICAILGLRSLYFVVRGVMGLFHLLKFGLALVLSFVGVKMVLTHSAYAVPLGWSLATIVSILAIAVIASLLLPQKETARPDDHS
jgi:tellurite resistance protein TerC